MQVGNPNGDKEGSKLKQPFQSMANIHESLGNADCLCHYRREILRKNDLSPDKKGAGVGDRFIHELFEWEQLSFFFLTITTSFSVFSSAF
jgi:hypothetical protein